MQYLKKSDLIDIFRGKRVAIVGSGPTALENASGYIDSFDLVVRINNYKTKGISTRGRPYDYRPHLGERCDYHFSFYGGSVRKTAAELKADGVKGHLCKCPNDDCHVTPWHKKNHQEQGGDFRPIYRRRDGFWIAPVYVPEKAHYMELFNSLGKHVPTTGFACIWELSQCYCDQMYITGFDFFKSSKHNVDEMWNPGKQDDPIKHMPDLEEQRFREMVGRNSTLLLDGPLKKIVLRSRRQ